MVSSDELLLPELVTFPEVAVVETSLLLDPPVVMPEVVFEPRKRYKDFCLLKPKI